MTDLSPGAVIEVPYPFVRDTYEAHDGEGPFSAKTWRPGVRFELVEPDSSQGVYDDMGAMILTIVDIHRPGRFPTRVFYTRQWRTPAGRTFGKGNLRITTQQNFRLLIRGYRFSGEVERAASAEAAA